ncbi:MAG: hypothetical protein U0R69_00775 [Gaiellales bacterium]
MLIVVGAIVLMVVLLFLLNTERWKRLGQGAKGVKRGVEEELHRRD